VEVRLDLHPIIEPGQGDPVADTPRHARRILRDVPEPAP
jgi:hypothetical protein